MHKVGYDLYLKLQINNALKNDSEGKELLKVFDSKTEGRDYLKEAFDSAKSELVTSNISDYSHNHHHYSLH